MPPRICTSIHPQLDFSPSRLPTSLHCYPRRAPARLNEELPSMAIAPEFTWSASTSERQPRNQYTQMEADQNLRRFGRFVVLAMADGHSDMSWTSFPAPFPNHFLWCSYYPSSLLKLDNDCRLCTHPGVACTNHAPPKNKQSLTKP